MKLLVFVVVAVALAQASQLNIKPAHLRPPVLPNAKAHKPNPRITGGVESTPHSRPYQVGLFIPVSGGTSFCGGSLISPTTVITAAHCGELSNQIEVRLGAHRIRDDESTQIRLTSSRVLVHPNWNSLLLQNDLALVFLPRAVELNANIQLVKLPARSQINNDFNGAQALASGWGLDSDGAETISDVLREITVPIGSNSGCNIYYFGAIIASHICAAGDNAKSTCSGDSGGPLVLVSTGELIGVTSFGISFGCEIGWPSVYSRVTSFEDWIIANVPDLPPN